MTVAVPTSNPSEGWLTYAPVRAELRVVERLLLDIGGPDDFASEVCTHLVRAGGKRLRPALVLLAASFGRDSRRDAIPIAVGVELIHLASLYLDDVMDESTSRRGADSANAKWGNVNAVLAGQYLLAKGTELICSGGKELAAGLARTTESLWRGQMREAAAAYNLDQEVSALLETIHLKTGSLYEFACQAGAVVGRVGPDETEALCEFGSKLGTMFQLVDDVLDLVAQKPQLGKPPGTDLVEGIYTMPVAITLAGKTSGGERLRRVLGRGKPGSSQLQEAIELLKSNRSISMTMYVAADIANEALLTTDSLPRGAARDSLRALVDFLLNRAAGSMAVGLDP